MLFTAFCTLRSCEPGEIFRDKFSRLLLTGTLVLSIGCLVLIAIPIYYDIVPRENGRTPELNIHYTYPDLSIYTYAGPEGATGAPEALSDAQAAFALSGYSEYAPPRQQDLAA